MKHQVNAKTQRQEEKKKKREDKKKARKKKTERSKTTFALLGKSTISFQAAGEPEPGRRRAPH